MNHGTRPDAAAAAAAPRRKAHAPRGPSRGGLVLAGLVLVALARAAGGAAAPAAPANSNGGGALNLLKSALAAPRRSLLRQSGFYDRVTDYAWRQTDISVRQDQQSQLILQQLRRPGGNAADANAVATSLLGSQRFGRKSSLSLRNNMDMNLRRYARPGQSGALGAVYRRIHPRTFRTGDKDTDFSNGVWTNVMLGEMRGAQARHEMDLRRARQAAQERAAVPAPSARLMLSGAGGGVGEEAAGEEGAAAGAGADKPAAKGRR